MEPYVYKIKHVPTGTYYIGSQYGRNSNPKNFWTTYKTSSKRVKKLVEDYGAASFEICWVKPREDARDFEAKLLQRIYSFLGKDKFKQLMINRTLCPGIVLDAEIIRKANGPGKRLKCRESALKRVLEGTHNFVKDRKPKSEESKLKAAEKMRGHKFNVGKTRSQETKNLIASKSKGNTNVRGTKWWTDGQSFVRSFECPGDGFILGAPKPNEDTRKKLSETSKGRKHTEDTKTTMSEIAKNRPSNAKGTIWVINKEGLRKRVKECNIPDGFVSVKYKGVFSEED